MADPHWTSYVGMATGVAGFVLAFISLKKTSSLKSLDLRLELGKTVNKIENGLSQATKLIDDANNSRVAVASAMGRGRSGMMVRWGEQIETDKNTINQLSNDLLGFKDYTKLNQNKLESNLLGIHKIEIQLIEIKDKYNKSIADDDNNRNHIREDMRSKHTPR